MGKIEVELLHELDITTKEILRVLKKPQSRFKTALASIGSAATALGILQIADLIYNWFIGGNK